jgi:hypothetical protein
MSRFFRGRSRGRSFRRRFVNQRKRKNLVQGILVLGACAIGGVVGSWGGAAIGFLLSGVLVCWSDSTPNP